MKFQLDICTDLGLVRQNNEDHLYYTTDLTTGRWSDDVMPEAFEGDHVAFIVADGMGGEVAGEIASEMAIKVISEYLNDHYNEALSETDLVKIMNDALLLAHNKISEYVTSAAEYYGMGTTATICIIKDAKLYISWVGDSRVYRYSEAGKLTNYAYNQEYLEILTQDHSQVWYQVLAGTMTVEEARVADYSNIITQSLGDYFRTPIPEHRVYKIYKDDIIICCSDGLNAMIPDTRIEQLIGKRQSDTDLARSLTQEANLIGGHDNISVISCVLIDGPTFVDNAHHTIIKSNSPLRMDSSITDAQRASQDQGSGFAVYLEKKRQVDVQRKKNKFYLTATFFIIVLIAIISYLNRLMIRQTNDNISSVSMGNDDETGVRDVTNQNNTYKKVAVTDSEKMDTPSDKSKLNNHTIPSSDAVLNNNVSATQTNKSVMDHNKIQPLQPLKYMEIVYKNQVDPIVTSKLYEDEEIRTLLIQRDTLLKQIILKNAVGQVRDSLVPYWKEVEKLQNNRGRFMNCTQYEKQSLKLNIENMIAEMKNYLNQ